MLLCSVWFGLTPKKTFSRKIKKVPTVSGVVGHDAVIIPVCTVSAEKLSVHFGKSNGIEIRCKQSTELNYINIWCDRNGGRREDRLLGRYVYK